MNDATYMTQVVGIVKSAFQGTYKGAVVITDPRFEIIKADGFYYQQLLSDEPSIEDVSGSSYTASYEITGCYRL